MLWLTHSVGLLLLLLMRRRRQLEYGDGHGQLKSGSCSTICCSEIDGSGRGGAGTESSCYCGVAMADRLVAMLTEQQQHFDQQLKARDQQECEQLRAKLAQAESKLAKAETESAGRSKQYEQKIAELSSKNAEITCENEKLTRELKVASKLCSDYKYKWAECVPKKECEKLTFTNGSASFDTFYLMANGQYLSVDYQRRLVVGDKNLLQPVAGKFKLLKLGTGGGSVCFLSPHLNKCSALFTDTISLVFHADNVTANLEMSQSQVVAITSLTFKLRSLVANSSTAYLVIDCGLIRQKPNSFANAVTFTLEPVGPENSF